MAPTQPHDRVVVLTGAAGGIGRAIAHRLSQSGARLALVDIDAAGLASLAADLGDTGRTSTHTLDLRDTAALPGLARDVLSRHGSIDVLINNAGLTVHGPLNLHTTDDIDRVLDVDLRAVVHAVHVFLPHLRARPGAHVVNIASMAGMQGFPFQSTYSAAKAGLRGFGQALRPELAVAGIGCSTILPGTIATSFLASATTRDPSSSARLAGLMLRFGASPDRVARAVQRAIARNRAEVRVGWDCHLMALARLLCPPLVPWVLQVALRRGFFGAVAK